MTVFYSYSKKRDHLISLLNNFLATVKSIWIRNWVQMISDCVGRMTSNTKHSIDRHYKHHECFDSVRCTQVYPFPPGILLSWYICTVVQRKDRVHQTEYKPSSWIVNRGDGCVYAIYGGGTLLPDCTESH
jgi:hypothetical protein